VRFLGLAARFVSGYIFVPDVHPATTVGGGATHAWLQVYLPGAGWVDFDPTNSIIGNRNLIRVAVAWGPEQALPLWGSFIGSASSYRGMEVVVSVGEEGGAARGVRGASPIRRQNPGNGHINPENDSGVVTKVFAGSSKLSGDGSRRNLR
jgi:hypothetical protein